MVNKLNTPFLYALFLVALVASTTLITLSALAATTVTFNTCDSSGVKKTIFYPAWTVNAALGWHGGENVFFTASGLSPSTTYSIYVFIKNESWTTGMAFPVRYYNTATDITTDGSGDVAPTSIYSDIAAGEFYVAVDINGNGIYDSGDLLINNVVVTLALITTDAGYNPVTTLYLTPAQIYAMPTYTSVGEPRRTGGVYPPEQIGNYTGVPLQYLANLVGGMSNGGMMYLATNVDDYVATMTYAQIYDNAFTQYNITTKAMISSPQYPMLPVLAYAVNGSKLPSDGINPGLDSDLGGPFRNLVVSSTEWQSSIMNHYTATFGNIMTKCLCSIVIPNPASLKFNTTNSAGVAKNSFNYGNNVYCSTSGLSASTTYPVYVVPDVSAWTVRIPLPARVSGSVTSVATDSSGNIAPTSIYANAQTGQYALIVDGNHDGQYDEGDLITHFAIVAFECTLTMFTRGSGAVSPGNQTYLSGTAVNLKAFTSQGWGFAGWSGDASGYENTTIIITGDITVTATFTQDSYILTMITVGQGSVSPGNQTCLSGTNVNLQASNAQGWSFAGWSGDTSATGNTTIIMNSGKTVTATFKQQFTLTIYTTGQGTVSPGNQTCTDGDSVTLQAAASSGYKFSSWGGNVTGTDNPATITMNGNATVTAAFTQETSSFSSSSSTSSSSSSSSQSHSSSSSPSPTPTPTPTATPSLTPSATPSTQPTPEPQTYELSLLLLVIGSVAGILLLIGVVLFFLKKK